MIILVIEEEPTLDALEVALKALAGTQEAAVLEGLADQIYLATIQERSNVTKWKK